ncbi:hypothetical protein WR25_05722 [Diploscapter pachys]|uniref:Secreted protein n=1 Tax=Diploscapter pachys TaxID=2018661 RepID=A0A2A2LTL5_9BILA|nr:hypothetical protein WR25_05722 [Diploscapter pachys]
MKASSLLEFLLSVRATCHCAIVGVQNVAQQEENLMDCGNRNQQLPNSTAQRGEEQVQCQLVQLDNCPR